MKSLILIAAGLLLFIVSANAQTQPVKRSRTNSTTTGANNKATTAAVVQPTGIDKAINRANNAVSSANNSVNNAGIVAKNTMNAAKNSASQIKGVTGKMDSLMGPRNPSANTAVTIKVPGANRAKIKELCEIIKSCPSVNAKNVDYDTEQQNITISSFKGKLNDLLDEIEKQTPLVTDNNASVSKAHNDITINLQ